MDEVKRALEEEILVEREELKDNLQELGAQARAMVDWRHHYRNNTGTALALTFGAGVALALLVPDKPRRGRARAVSEVEPGEERVRERERAGFRKFKKLADNPAGRHVTDTAYGIFDALLGVMSAKAVNLVSDLVSGFREEYDSRRGSRRRSEVTH